MCCLDWLGSGVKRPSGTPQMAVPFVPFPFPADWTGVSRSRARRGSPIHTASSIEPSPPESISRVRGVGPWDTAVDAPTAHDSWSRPKGGLSDGSSTPLEGEGSLEDSWVERPIIPILLGYEIREERSKFTVYKILVTGGRGGSRMIFRRYTDFCRLSDKLKELFPSIGLALPPKHWFKNNYDEEFLEERRIGLQTFLQNLSLHRDIISSEAVKHFLCLAEPLSPFDSLEESRAFCETLEDTNHRLQRELLESQSEVDALKKTLEERENHIGLLMKKVKHMLLSSESFDGSCQRTSSITTDRQREGDSHVTQMDSSNNTKMKMKAEDAL